MSDSLPRVNHASPISEDIKNKTLSERLCWFFFCYNWETREKKVFLIDDESPDIQKEFKDSHEWHRIYKIQARLPIPPIVDNRKVIDLTADGLWEMKDRMGESETPILAFARRLFINASNCVSPFLKFSSVRSRWLSSLDGKKDKTMKFSVETDHGSFLVTITGK